MVQTGRGVALLVHLFTASGVLWALLTALAISAGDFRWAGLWMLVALAVDSTDGSLARRYRVQELIPQIDGRRMDDIVDYLNYTFLPLLILSKANWIPQPHLLWIGLAALTSLFAFVHRDAKKEREGFFLGFPSYWNVFVLYVMLLLSAKPYWVLFLLFCFSCLTVLPVKFVYPSRATRWAGLFVGGGVLWFVLLFLSVLRYPSNNPLLIWATMIYPVAYLLLSFYLDFAARREQGRPA